MPCNAYNARLATFLTTVHVTSMFTVTLDEDDAPLFWLQGRGVIVWTRESNRFLTELHFTQV